jgi:preprotein translocase subunit YajC
VGLVIVLVALFALMWLLMIRPQRQRTNAQLRMQDTLGTGDEIITAGGIHGTVKAIEDDVLDLEIAPGITVRLDRRAVAAVASAEVAAVASAEESGAEDETEDESRPVSPGES